MPSRRPALFTLIAAVNLLAAVVGGAAVAVGGYVNFSEIANPPQAPPPEPPMNPAQGAPGMMRPDVVQQRPRQPKITRPPLLTEQPLTYLRDRQRQLIRQIPVYELYALTLTPLAAALVLLLAASGIALLRMRPVGRRLALWFAGLALLVTAGSAAFTWVFVVPEIQHWQESRGRLFDYLQEPRPVSDVAIVYTTEGVALLLGGVWPLILLAALLRPSARADFKPAASAVTRTFVKPT
ncbi:MAG: hypothetical protein ACJ8F7_14585 [Gemmataceae bacterium]